MKSQIPNSGRTARPSRAVAGLSLLLLAAVALPASAQTVTVVAQPIRATVPVSSTDSNGLAFTATVDSVASPVHLSASGLPNGATASVSTNDLWTTTDGVLTLNTVNVPEGVYPFTLEATGGAANSLALTLQSAHIWSGAAFTNGGSADFSAAANWVGGNVPGSASDVVLTDLGGLGSDDTSTNVWIAADTEIGSLRQAITSGATRRHNIYIDPGMTLRITGANGLSVLRDRSDTSQEWRLAFFGDQGTLIVSNQNASIRTFNSENQNGRLLLDGLGTFIADVDRVHISDYSVFPNFENLKANGYNGAALPRRMPPGHNYLARTNIITCRFPVDPNDWSDPTFRLYSMVVGNNEQNGTTQRQPFRFGISNAFFMNSVCFAHAGVSMDGNGAAVFNPAFASLGCVAIFRGTDGGRMAMFALADNAGPGSAGNHSKVIMDFSAGTVDALVDRLWLSRNRTNANDAVAESTLTMAAGTFDVNNAILGYQDQGNNQGSLRGYCRGTLNVNTTAVFRVNQTLELGYTTADAVHPTAAEDGYGRIFMNGGGTLMASNITVGGVTKISLNNDISLTSGSHLIVTNGIGAVDARLNQLSLNDSTLTLHVDGARPDAYVHVRALSTSGTANAIRLATIDNLSAYPAQVALIAYDTATASFSLKLPEGFYGYLLDNTGSKTIDAIITTNPPPQVVWDGAVNGNWDVTTANWKDGLKFLDGAPPTFDDTAAGITSITVVGTVAPGEVLITNNVKNYTFGGGMIVGTSPMTKEGTGSLTMDASSQLPLLLNAGTVNGGGALGTTTVAFGATLDFSGLINGLISSGTATASGTINNGISIQGGTFLGSGTISGPVTISGGSALLTGSVNATGTSTVEAGASLALDGRFNNTTARLNVNGTLSGNGVVSDPDGYTFGNDGRLAINSGATVLPGHSLGVLSVEGRFDLNQNARLVVEVDMNNPTRHDIVATDVFGNIRGIIVMTNIGAVPFAVGQSFHVISNNFNLANTPLNPNIDFRFEPASPGLGMVWDGSDLATNGIVKIAAITSTPTALTTVVSGDQMTFSWPESHLGWVLQQQTRSLAQGISLLPADWAVIANSHLTNQVNVTINPNTEAAFYRLAHP